jgi:hypothetical protein
MQQIGEVSDAQLVTSIARYSEVALAEVYRRHGGAVYGLARRVLNNPTEAEDVTQEVFLRLWNQPDRFDPGPGAPALVPAGPVPRPGRRRHPLAQLAAAARGQGRPAHGQADYDMQHEVWDLALADKVSGAWASCPRRSAGPSSWPTSRAAPTSRWRSCSTSPRGRSRAGSATACGACGPLLVEAGVQGVDA